MNRSVNYSKELIGRSIDELEPLPDWLVERISEDRSLKEFQDASVQLAADLRHSSDGWVNLHLQEDMVRARSFVRKVPLKPVATLVRLRTLVVASAAAIVLALVGHSLLAPSQWWNKTEQALVHDQNEPGRTSDQPVPGAPETANLRVSQPAADGLQLPSSGDQFEKYFFVTVESSFRTFQSVGETLSNRAVGEPLQRTIQASGAANDDLHVAVPSLANADSQASPLQPRHSENSYSEPSPSQPSPLHQKQIQLIRELMETTDFLVETLPKEVTQSWMDLSVASNSSH